MWATLPVRLQSRVPPSGSSPREREYSGAFMWPLQSHVGPDERRAKWPADVGPVSRPSAGEVTMQKPEQVLPGQKWCSKCEEIKPLVEFGQSKDSADGCFP